jgi:hypothetical protein
MTLVGTLVCKKMDFLYKCQYGLVRNNGKDFEFEIQTKPSLYSLNSLQIWVDDTVYTL